MTDQFGIPMNAMYPGMKVYEVDGVRMKPCTKCGGEFTLDKFCRRGESWQSWCKMCQRDHNRVFGAGGDGNGDDVTHQR